MALALSIGGLEFRIEAPPPVLDAAAERYASFEARNGGRRDGAAPIVIQVRGEGRGPESMSEFPGLTVAHLRSRDEVELEGGARGRYHLAERRGFVENADGFAPMDALIRVALSTALPLEGGLLLHAAALRRGEGDGVALCGASGTGKSTAASSLGGACDELAVLRLGPGEGVDLLSTPYWRGRRFRERCSEVSCLSRSPVAQVRRLRGAAAARLLARHVVRYVAHPGIERSIFRLIGAVCDRLPVREAACPEGEAFIPFLAEELGWKEAS